MHRCYCFVYPLFLLILVIAVPSVRALPTGYPATDRSKLRINDGWRFHLGDPQAAYYEKNFDDSDWEVVNAPHSLKLTSLSLDDLRDEKTQLIFHRDVGWYRRNIQVEADSSKRVFLEFEGAHQVTDVWVNGQHVGQHAVGGYTPFHFDITDFVKFGQANQVTLLLDNRRRDDVPPDPGPFDYVKFGGLYRDVYLVHTNSLRIQFNWEGIEAGITFTTPSVDVLNMNATLNVKTGIHNGGDADRACTVVNRVIDDDGFVVLKLVSDTVVPAGQTMTVNQIGGIEENLRLWGIEDPYLYRLHSMILDDGEPIDAVETRVGIRTFELDPDEGFKLNGKAIELIGMNRHQHYGYIGDAMPDSLHYMDMLQFKQLGFNVMRTAHYPHDNAIMEACDELGILAYEEAPTWIDMGNESWFDNLEKATRAMVRNHRNHPSLVIWGAGINHRGYVPRIHYAAKQENPFRMTASQSSRWTGWQTSGLTDIFGNMLYGPVFWDRQEPMLAMEGRHGAEEVAKFKRDPRMPGLISWTAHAYYTFHEAWEWETGRDRTRLGVMSVFRRPKEKLMWYASELTSAPMLHIESPWTDAVDEIEAYSNCEQVEVFVNGSSRGIFSPSDDPVYNGLDHPPFLIDSVDYDPGELRIDGITDGKVLVSQTIHTPGKPVAVNLSFDIGGRDWLADGSDIVVGHAEIVDVNGTVIDTFEGDIKFFVKGDAAIVGDGAGIRANPFHTTDGVAPVLVRSGQQPGRIEISAKAKGLEAATAVLQTSAYDPDVIAATAQPIYDMRIWRVDMGAPDQLVQFDWTPWHGTDHEPSTLAIPWHDGASVAVSPYGGGDIRWLGEMNVIGKFAFVYGEGVLVVDEGGLVLEFSGLPAGNYALRSYHHAPRSNTDQMDPNQEKLKDQKIAAMPYAKRVVATVQGRSRARDITMGKELQYQEVTTIYSEFHSDGKHPISIVIQSDDDTPGVWLNGFELAERP